MKRTALILVLVLFPLVFLSCTKQTSYTVAATHDDKILVAQSKETMEYLIDCSITRNCPRVPVMELLYDRKVFFVEAGASVELGNSLFSLSNARKVRVLTGEHSGQYCWVYDRMLYHDRSSLPYQLAFARISETGSN
jgi:hypothetical protein